MNESRKYGRTYHYPFSPGTTSDDRINHQWWADLSQLAAVVHTEKLDGENTCLSKHGVFARSHAAPTRHPWANFLKQRWELIKSELGELEVFGENLYAEHSIRYSELECHFFVFGVRDGDRWLSWEETLEYSEMLGFATVPEVKRVEPREPKSYEQEILAIVEQPSAFDSIDVEDGAPCTMEGVVTRDLNEYSVEDFPHRVFKYVRKGHVKTDVHWRRNWKRARLKWEH